LAGTAFDAEPTSTGISSPYPAKHHRRGFWPDTATEALPTP